jgi:hypothetical protein
MGTPTPGAMVDFIEPPDSIAFSPQFPQTLPSTFSAIPIELLDLIIDRLVTHSASRLSIYKTLSLVSKHLRSVTIPLIFHEFVISFYVESFYHLLSFSESSFAPYVHHIRYQAPAFLNPKALEPSSYNRPIFLRGKSPQGHASNLLSSLLCNRMEISDDELEKTYNNIYSTLSTLQSSHSFLVNSHVDGRTLSTCLPRFKNLKSFTLDLLPMDRMLIQFEKLLPVQRLLLPCSQSSASHHLSTLLEALINSKGAGGVTPESVAIRGICPSQPQSTHFHRPDNLHPSPTSLSYPSNLSSFSKLYLPCTTMSLAHCPGAFCTCTPAYDSIIGPARFSLANLHLSVSDGTPAHLFTSISSTLLPALTTLHLTASLISLDAFEKLVLRQAPRLQNIHLEDVCFMIGSTCWYSRGSQQLNTNHRQRGHQPHEVSDNNGLPSSQQHTQNPLPEAEQLATQEIFQKIAFIGQSKEWRKIVVKWRGAWRRILDSSPPNEPPWWMVAQERVGWHMWEELLRGRVEWDVAWRVSLGKGDGLA